MLERNVLQARIGMVIEVLSAILAVATSIGFVFLTYLQEYKNNQSDSDTISTFNYLDYFVCVIFLIIYLFKLYVAQHRFQFLISIQSMLDLLIIIPVIVWITPDQSSFWFLFIAVSRLVRAVSFGIIIAKYFKLGSTDVDRQINVVVMTMCILIYISSGVFTVVENRERAVAERYQFHDALYFGVVTLLTVGYGDITPQTEFGKFIVIFIVIFTIVLIPKQTNELLRLMSKKLEII